MPGALEDGRENVKDGDIMKATQQLHNLGQSLWLDNITRDLLDSGTLGKYIEELSVTGLTSNPTIFDHAIKNSAAYDAAIRDGLRKGSAAEQVFFNLALEDITRAADLFRPIHERTNGTDGWVSLEVSPMVAHDTASTIAAAKDLHARAKRPNVFIKIPGTKEGLASHRRGDLRRHSRERDAAVLARPIPGVRGGVPARGRAPHRFRPESGCGFGRVCVHQPLGHRRRGEGSGDDAKPPRNRASENRPSRLTALSSPRSAGSAR